MTPLPSASTQPKCSPNALLGRVLGARELSVLVGVEGLERRLERFHPRFAAGERGHDHGVLVRDGGADRALRRQRHPPARLTRGRRVAIQPRRAEHHELRLDAVARREHHRRGPRHGDTRALAPPALPAGAAIDGDHERSAHLIADQDHHVAGDDRGAGHAIEVLERPQRQRPALLAVGRIRDETEVGEEGDHALAVGGRGRRRRIVGLVERMRAGAGPRPTPHLAAARRVEGDGQELVALARGHVDAVADDHGRRLRVRHRGLPQDVAGRREGDGIAGAGVDASAIRPAELRPLAEGRTPSRQDAQDHTCTRHASSSWHHWLLFAVNRPPRVPQNGRR